MRHSSYSTADLAPSDRLEASRTAAQAWSEVTPPDGAGEMTAAWDMWTLGDLVLSRATHSPLRHRREPGRFRRHDNEFLLLEAYQSGVGRGRVEDATFENRPGRIVLIDMSLDFVALTSRMLTHSLLIPHETVGYDPTMHQPVHVLDAGSPRGRILGTLLASLPARVGSLADDDACGLARDLAEVVGTIMLRPEAPLSDAVRRGRLIAMENFIERRLGDPTLGPDALCAAFGVSRASLYRQFETRSGVAAYIRERRLIAAKRALAGHPRTRGLVRDVAQKFGFHDPAHFNRLFRRRFGLTPGEAVLEFRTVAAVPTDPATLLIEWLSPSG